MFVFPMLFRLILLRSRHRDVWLLCAPDAFTAFLSQLWHRLHRLVSYPDTFPTHFAGYHVCRITSNRSSFSFVPDGMSALRLAMSICCFTVSTPSRSGRRSPRLPPALTITPYRFTSSCSGESMGSGTPSTSTLISSHSSSSSVMGSNRGSFDAALTAFSMISSATHSLAGRMVPMQPRSFPYLWIDTNTPARG